MGWLRLVGSLKLYVSLAKEPYKRDLYSVKETYNFKEPTNPKFTIHNQWRGWAVCGDIGMGWLRLVGSLKLYVSLAKEPYKRDYILQKRPIILRSLLIVATPYEGHVLKCIKYLYQCMII